MEPRKLCSTLLILFLLVGHLHAGEYLWLDGDPRSSEDSLEKRVPVPPGFERLDVTPGSFADWLRKLPLRPEGSPVRLYPVEKGVLKCNQEAHVAVVNLDVLKDQECADSLIRLWAEFLWASGRADEICFRFVRGDRCFWKDWREGERFNPGTAARIQGAPDASRRQFIKYLGTVMAFANTTSLKCDLEPVDSGQLFIGDGIIEPGPSGYPGHAVMVLDMARNREGHLIMLFGQGYMPSQEFHVLKNPGSHLSPWYPVYTGGELNTPEWRFVHPALRRYGPVNASDEAASPGD